MINQEFKAQGTKYQVLPNFAICCMELKVLRVANFRACVLSFCSVLLSITAEECYFVDSIAVTARFYFKMFRKQETMFLNDKRAVLSLDDKNVLLCLLKLLDFAIEVY